MSDSNITTTNLKDTNNDMTSFNEAVAVLREIFKKHSNSDNPPNTTQQSLPEELSLLSKDAIGTVKDQICNNESHIVCKKDSKENKKDLSILDRELENKRSDGRKRNRDTSRSRDTRNTYEEGEIEDNETLERKIENERIRFYYKLDKKKAEEREERRKYRRLCDDFEKSEKSYDDLKKTHDDLKKSHVDLKKSYDELKKTHETDYNKLMDSYEGIRKDKHMLDMKYAELLRIVRRGVYKNVRCKYDEKGVCNYGDDCCYLHSTDRFYARKDKPQLVFY